MTPEIWARASPAIMLFVHGDVFVQTFGEKCTMAFIKFLRILVGVTVLWLLFRLLFPRDKRRRPVILRGKNERHRRHSKFVESSVISEENRTDRKTGP